MDASPSRSVTPTGAPEARGAAVRAVPLDARHVMVPLDGSPFAERALPVAAWAVDALGADLHLVEVVEPGTDTDGAIRYLDSVSRRHRGVRWEVVEHGDVGEALAGVLSASSGRMACMATHGRDRTAKLLGSVAGSLLERTPRPVLLVGPAARAVISVDAPVVVAVDGSDRDDTLVATALGWADRLARRLEIVTVAEPAPPGYREGAPRRRARGPAQPESYLAELAGRVAAPGTPVTFQVSYDPVSVRDGLVPLLDRMAALVVLGSRHRAGLPQMMLGSHAARIVHDAGVPALVVPAPEP